MFNLTVITNLIIIILVLVAIWIIFGVIWRTRNGLDVCHKWLLGAIIALGLGSILRILDDLAIISVGTWLIIPNILVVIFFILGLWKMRNIIRRINGEIK